MSGRIAFCISAMLLEFLTVTIVRRVRSGKEGEQIKPDVRAPDSPLSSEGRSPNSSTDEEFPGDEEEHPVELETC
jgi:hypothetical protein